jgi:hypothetical protein
VSDLPFGHEVMLGERPKSRPIARGPWAPFTVYMRGDVVRDDHGQHWRALRDYRSGRLPPAVVAADFPDTVWERCAEDNPE